MLEKENENKSTAVNNEKDYINKSLQLHRFPKIKECIQKCFHTHIKSLTLAFKKSKMAILT